MDMIFPNMNSESTPNATKSAIFAYVAPFAVFMLLLMLSQILGKFVPPSDNVWIAKPEYLIYPLQTLICGALLLYVWKLIEFRGIAYLSITFAIGFFVFAIWTSPQFFHWAPPRRDGFNPEVFAPGSLSYGFTVFFRFFRLVIIVPIVEELFWRGFLMRYLVNENFTKVPFGTFRWMSFLVTTVGFTLEHQSSDYVVAAICGIIFNGVACFTKSLGSCIFVHAVTNLFLGLYIMFTKQWGFW